MTLRRLLLLSASTALLSGCCTMSRLFCGPDDTAWVSETYGTPTEAVQTLLEAVRRDRADVVYRTFAAEFKARHRLDALSAQLAWQRLREEVPGLHLVGYAEVPAPERLADKGATFVISASGRRLRVDVVMESFREIHYRRPDGSLGESRVPVGSWNTLARVEWIDDPDEDRSRLILEPMPFHHEGLGRVPIESIEWAGLVRLWKVSDLRMLDS